MSLDDDKLPPRKPQPPQVQPSADVPTPTRLPAKAQPEAVKFEESGRNRHICRVPEAHTLEDVKDPGYLWRSVSKIRPFDEVTFLFESFEWYVRILIIEVNEEAQALEFRILIEESLLAKELVVPTMDGAFISELGDGWAVRMGQAVLKSGFKSEAQAGKWLDEKTQSLRKKKG